ncbi:hypothetical protein LEP1GSC127_3999 [Leptospira kirschneri str. 200801925]|nr:hypothetical protein LEP1GSC127_3999 [Leptospira kirschneri str. 200801925]
MSGNPDKQPRSHRYHPGVYADYIIQIEFGLITLHAKIGNISETGICLILNGEDLNMTESVYGSVIEKNPENVSNLKVTLYGPKKKRSTIRYDLSTVLNLENLSF